MGHPYFSRDVSQFQSLSLHLPESLFFFPSLFLSLFFLSLPPFSLSLSLSTSLSLSSLSVSPPPSVSSEPSLPYSHSCSFFSPSFSFAPKFLVLTQSFFHLPSFPYPSTKWADYPLEIQNPLSCYFSHRKHEFSLTAFGMFNQKEVWESGFT